MAQTCNATPGDDPKNAEYKEEEQTVITNTQQGENQKQVCVWARQEQGDYTHRKTMENKHTKEYKKEMNTRVRRLHTKKKTPAKY